MSVNSTMVNLFINVLTVEQKPQEAVNVIIRNMKAGLKVQKKVAQKDFLKACLTKRLYPKDIETAAKLLAKGDVRKVAKEGRGRGLQRLQAETQSGCKRESFRARRSPLLSLLGHDS